jgi:hypothetical protein
VIHMEQKDKPERIPERKLPEFKITNEHIQQLKTTSAILNMLADNTDLTKRIAQAFVKASSVKAEDRLLASMDLKDQVTKMVAEKLKDVPADQIEKYYPIWSNIIIRVNIPRVITPYIWGPDPAPQFGRGFE